MASNGRYDGSELEKGQGFVAEVAMLTGGKSLAGELSRDVATRWSELPHDALRFVDTDSDNAFVRTPWLSSWYEVFVPRGWTPQILVVRRSGTVIGVAPLIVRAAGPVRHFRFAGHGLGNYLDVVAGEERGEVVAALLDHVRSTQPAVLEWHDVNSGSASWPLLSGHRSTGLYPNPRASFREPWAQHFHDRVANRKSRRRLLKARELLEARGALVFIPEVASLDDHAFDEIRKLHMARFQGTPNPLLKASFWRFFRLLTQRGLGRDAVISLLRSQGALVSVLFGLRNGGTYVSYLLAFDPSLEKLQPGNVHLMLFQEHLIGSGWTAIDFSKGDDRYKRRWSSDETWNFDVMIGYGLFGSIAAALLYERSRLRAWARARGLTRLARKALSRRRPLVPADQDP
jgi:CelD/BcsL family acetyltransferase involved in cellulose biosynthesis